MKNRELSEINTDSVPNLITPTTGLKAHVLRRIRRLFHTNEQTANMNQMIRQMYDIGERTLALAHAAVGGMISADIDFSKRNGILQPLIRQISIPGNEPVTLDEFLPQESKSQFYAELLQVGSHQPHGLLIFGERKPITKQATPFVASQTHRLENVTLRVLPSKGNYDEGWIDLSANFLPTWYKEADLRREFPTLSTVDMTDLWIKNCHHLEFLYKRGKVSFPNANNGDMEALNAVVHLLDAVISAIENPYKHGLQEDPSSSGDVEA